MAIPGIKALRKLQMGKETTPGTKVDATTVWIGNGLIADNSEHVFGTEDIGILSGSDREYITYTEAGLSLQETEATFEQLPYLFEMGIKSATPTTDSAGAYTYTYTMPYSAATSFHRAISLPTLSRVGTMPARKSLATVTHVPFS